MPGETPLCYVRFLHAVPGAPRLDVLVNGEALSTIGYGDFTEYHPGYPGIYHMEIYQAGKRNAPLVEDHIELADGRIYTVSALGSLKHPAFELIHDRPRTIDASKAYIRFINLIPFDSSVRVTLNNKEAARELSYREVSDYLITAPGDYRVNAVDTATGRLVLEDPHMVLKGGKVYAGYFTGREEDDPEPQILIPLEGASYLRF